MGGITIGGGGHTIEDQMRMNKRFSDEANADPADRPMKGNRLSPKEQHKAILRDIKFLRGEIPEEKYGRMFPFGSTTESKRKQVEQDLRKDSEVGRYAVPGYGDEGQFLAKGGKVKSKASSRADGCAQRGKTRGRII